MITSLFLSLELAVAAQRSSTPDPKRALPLARTSLSLAPHCGAMACSQALQKLRLSMHHLLMTPYAGDRNNAITTTVHVVVSGRHVFW
jgi:hypothetical protein